MNVDLAQAIEDAVTAYLAEDEKGLLGAMADLAAEWDRVKVARPVVDGEARLGDGSVVKVGDGVTSVNELVFR